MPDNLFGQEGEGKEPADRRSGECRSTVLRNSSWRMQERRPFKLKFKVGGGAVASNTQEN